MKTPSSALTAAASLLIAACGSTPAPAPSQLQLIFQGRSEGEIEPCG